MAGFELIKNVESEVNEFFQFFPFSLIVGSTFVERLCWNSPAQ